MAWIRLIYVVFCIGSIRGLPQTLEDIIQYGTYNGSTTTSPSDDSKPSDLTKNPIENPSSVDSKPSDLMEVVVFATKLVLEFIWNQVNDAISGNWNEDAFWDAFHNALIYTYYSIATHIAISMANSPWPWP